MEPLFKMSQPESFQVEKDRGDKLLAKEEFDAAIECYKHAIKQRPQFWGAYYYMGEALLKQQRYHDAAVAFHSASLYARGRPEPSLMAGRALFRAEFYVDACFVFERIDDGAFDPDSALYYALSLLKCKRPEEALRLKNNFILCENKSAVRLLLADAYILLHQFTDALLYIEDEILASGETHEILKILADIYFGLGEIAQAEIAMKKCLRHQILNRKNRINDTGLLPKEGFMPVHDAKIVLEEVCRVLDNNNIPYFLEAGTLLGIMRDGDLLPYDKDMDIGVLGESSYLDLIHAFKDLPDYELQSPRNDYEKNKYYWNVVIFNRKLEISTDIFFYKEINGLQCYGFYNPCYPVIWMHRKFDLKRFSFNGYQYSVPSTSSSFLEEMYGPNWQVKDPFFESVISSPNLNKGSLPVTKVFGLLKVYNCLLDERFMKAKKILEQIFVLDGDAFVQGLLGDLAE